MKTKVNLIIFLGSMLVLVAWVVPVSAQAQNLLIKEQLPQFKARVEKLFAEKRISEFDDLRRTPVSLSARLWRDQKYPGDARLQLTGLDNFKIDVVVPVFYKLGTAEPYIDDPRAMTPVIDCEEMPFGNGNYTASVALLGLDEHGLPNILGFTSIRFWVGWDEGADQNIGIQLGKSFSFFVGSGWYVYVFAKNVDPTTTVLVTGPRGWKPLVSSVSCNGQSIMFWVPYSEGYPYKDDVLIHLSVTAKDFWTGESVTSTEPLVVQTTLWWELF